MNLDLRSVARVLGGEVVGRDKVNAPGPGHSKADRSLSIKLSATSPDGFVVHSYAGDDWQACRDYVLDRLGLPHDGWRRERPQPTPVTPAKPSPDPHKRERARWLWRRRRSIVDTPAERYLREARGYGGEIPATLAYLPASKGYEPAPIAAFGLCSEPEPGELAIADDAVMAVQLINLKPDGSGKADVDPNKITIGQDTLGSPIVLAPPNDLLGLAITEGIEDALSIHEATGLGAWAAGGAGRMPALADAVPDYIDFVTIVADRDPAGIKGANALAAGLRNRGINHAVSFFEGAT